MAENRSKSDGFMLRFPDGMRDHIKAEADRNGRSMNAEIVARLERSYTNWPNIEIPSEVIVRIARLPDTLRREAEAKINLEVIRILRETLGAEPEYYGRLFELLEELIEREDDPEKKQELVAGLSALKETMFFDEVDDK